MKMFINSTLVLIVLVVLVGHLVSARGNVPVADAYTPWVYTVQHQDTLWAVAKRYYPKMDPREAVYNIRMLNGYLETATIHPGQRLKMPKGSNRVEVEE